MSAWKPAVQIAMRCFRPITHLLAILIFTTVWAAAASAQVKRSEVVYHEQSKSWYQFVQHDVTDSKSWDDANKLARGLAHNGIQGRLAVVDDAETNEFLRKTFKPDVDTWIGLRYFCKFHKVVWVTGEILDRQGYQRWAGQWYRRSEITCENQAMDYMPVYFTPVSQGFRWQASGLLKKFYAYIVEFPGARE